MRNEGLELKGQAHVGTIKVFDGIVVRIAVAETKIQSHPVVVSSRHNGQASVIVGIIPIVSINGATHSSCKRKAKGLMRRFVYFKVAQTEGKTTAEGQSFVPSLYAILLKQHQVASCFSHNAQAPHGSVSKAKR